MTMLRFLPGVLVVQAATWALILVATAPSAESNWAPCAGLGVLVTALAALWFGSIADHVKKDGLANAAASFAREREDLRVRAEIDTRAALERNHRNLMQETRRAESRANLRLALGLSGLLSLGALLLAIEFMTIGLLILAAAGGALGGYLLRARQDRRAFRRQEAAEADWLRASPKPLLAGRLDSAPGSAQARPAGKSYSQDSGKRRR